MSADQPFGGAAKKMQQLLITTGFGFAGLRHGRA
jgi:hypothetical protein